MTELQRDISEAKAAAALWIRRSRYFFWQSIALVVLNAATLAWDVYVGSWWWLRIFPVVAVPACGWQAAIWWRKWSEWDQMAKRLERWSD